MGNSSLGVLPIISPTLTPRAVMDPSRKCALRCDFCYYLPTDDFYSVRDWDDVLGDIKAAKDRGCTHTDITGGEPLQYPDIVKLVATLVEHDIKPRIITSLICKEKTFLDVIDAGVDDWLISMHGYEAETHNEIVHIKNARAFQIERLTYIANRMKFCCNYVMIRKNQDEIYAWAVWVARMFKRKPRIVNYIMHNPHYGWRTSPDTMNLSCDLTVAGPLLDSAIDYLEGDGIGVNVRYTPYCALDERHWKNVCNDLHVAYDSGEWDNAIRDRTPEGVYNYGLRLSMGNEEKGAPCSQCDLQWICGGANKVWHEANTAVYGEQLRAQSLAELDDLRDHYAFRKYNALGMA